MWSAGEGDDKQRFLADLRALRDRAALEFDELAARAHYPSNVLKEAANGPTLPTLPILAAYVRACEGDVPEWEERWRRLGFDSRADAGLPVRPAGASPAAVAGARAGVSVAPPDAYDPDRIRAALRGSHGRSGRGRGAPVRDASAPSPASSPAPSPASFPASVEPIPESPASWSGRTSWDETTSWDTSTASAAGWGSGFQPDTSERWDGAATSPSGNGNHHAGQPVDPPSSATVFDAPDAARAEAIRRDPFSADWLQDSELTSPPGTEAGWAEQAETAVPEIVLPEAGVPEAAPGVSPSGVSPPGVSASGGAEESWFTPRETPGSSAANTEPPPTAEDTWFTPYGRAGTDLASAAAERELASAGEDLDEPIVTGFWTPSAAAAPSASAPSAPAPAAPAPSAPAEVQRRAAPLAPAPAEDHAVPSASWTGATEISAGGPPGAADRTTPMRVQAPIASASAATAASASAATAGAASVAGRPARTIAGPTVPPGPVVPPSKPKSDRLYLVRLLVVIVVAALIGSILVLLVR
jgi:hypothetical protein